MTKSFIYRYNASAAFRENVRFAFEGFFSLAEKGTWDVHSNNILKNMYVFPDNIKTWIIGDGYMENPRSTDPYYVGKIYGGYYMKPLDSKKDYQNYVDKKSPNSPIFKNCLNAFLRR